MHVSVQKFTSTTWPRRSAGPSGSELSHSGTPSREGMCTRPNIFASAQRPERCSDVFGEQLRLLPGREVSAPVVPVVVDEVGVGPLGPAPRGPIELVGEGAHADRDLH